MCEILFKAVDHRMPTAAEWRTWLNGELSKMQKYLSDHFDVPIVEVNFNRLVNYRDAKAAYKVIPLQKYLDIITAYEANPLTQAEIDRVIAYHQEDEDENKMLKPNIVGLWKYYRNQVEVEALKTDAVKEAELQDKDRHGAYKRGDPVVVMKDGHEWGKEERPPKFFVVKIPGLSVEAARKYIESEMDLTDPERPVILRRRLYGLPVDTLASNIKNAINNLGVVTVTAAQVKQFIINKKTGLPEP